MTQDVVSPPRINTAEMQRAEHRIGRSLEEFFEEKYVADRLTMEAVAAELGYSIGTVSRWMDRLGIPARPTWSRKGA